MRVLLDTAWLRLWVESGWPVVCMVRSSASLPSQSDALSAFYEDTIAAMSTVDRASHDLIVDGRQAVGRNDPAFERAQAQYRSALFGGFRRVVAVVRTPVGRLQVDRYVRSSPLPAFSHASSLEEALELLAAHGVQSATP